MAIGTGASNESIAYEEAKDWGLAEWGVHIYNVAADGVSNAADYQLKHVLDDRFTRFQVALREASEAMDDASATNLKNLEDNAQTLIESHAEELDAVCEQITG